MSRAARSTLDLDQFKLDGVGEFAGSDSQEPRATPRAAATQPVSRTAARSCAHVPAEQLDRLGHDRTLLFVRWRGPADRNERRACPWHIHGRDIGVAYQGARFAWQGAPPMGWFSLLMAGVLEIVWALGLKY